MDTLSISNSLSKNTPYENTEMSVAYFEDLKSRENDAISNERIQKGDRILDTYRVVSDAISGGMGSVWRVHHSGWNTDLAMKRPQPKFFAEGGMAKKKQFVEECENWIKLGLHPNIVSCYYVREIGGVPTIFSEWMDGGSLSDRIRDGALYEGDTETVRERMLRIAVQALKGLHYSHENGLIHQDMKPGNLLLTKDWEAKVADFGLAKARSGLESDATAAGSSGYTPAYCPAEQAGQEEPARWMDAYAWALTVLEMYAGRRLWTTGAEAKEHFDDYATQCVRPMPEKLRSLLRACLTDKPDGFDTVKGTLIGIYHEETGGEYPDVDDAELSDSAENLNNRALSFLDLRQIDNAEKYWEMALAQNPDHTESVINSILFKWYYDRSRLGPSYVIDAALISDLKRSNHNDIYSVTVLLYASILRCSREDALLYLEALEGLGAEQDELERFRTLIDEKCGQPELLQHFVEDQKPIAASSRGEVAVCGETEDSVRIVSVRSKEHRGLYSFRHSGSVSFAVFSEGGDLLALCGNNGITVWDINNRKMLVQNTGRHFIYALFDEEKNQVAAVLYDHTCVHKDGIVFDLGSGKEVRRFETRSLLNTPRHKIRFLSEEGGSLFVTVPNSESIVDCRLDAEGHMQYRFHPCRFRDYDNSQVCFRDIDAEIPILTLYKKSELQLSTELLSVKSGNGFDVYRVSTPDLSLRPHMELSRIQSIREQFKEKEAYQSLIREAEQLVGEREYFQALARIDAILALKQYGHDSRTLALRSEIDAHLKNKTFLKCIELRDFNEPLPPASPGTYPEAPQEIFEKASNCLSIDDAQTDHSGNLMAALVSKAMQYNDYPIQKVYCTADEHTFVCCGWAHERRQVGHTPDFDPIIQDSTAYRISLYNDVTKKLKVFPVFSSIYMKGLFLEGSYKYQMFVAYNEKYHRLVAGNEDYDTSRVTWDTETQTQVAEESVITSLIQLLSNPRYYLTSGESTVYIIDLKDNSILWTVSLKPGQHIKYHGDMRFDRERDIFQLELTDGSYLTGQVLWSYDTAEEPLEEPQPAHDHEETAPVPASAQEKKPAAKAKPTVDATLYVDDTKNFVITDGVLTKYTGKKTQILIPDTITAIADRVFSGCENIESITVPEGVTDIGDSVFENCKSLTDITLPESLAYIGDSAFAGCESLKTIVLPDNAINLGDSLFEGCKKLSSVKLPEDLTSISERMFAGCMFLRGVYIPEEVEVIGREAFKGCTCLHRITIPDCITVIGEGAFEDCIFMDAIEDMSYVLEIIEDRAFCSCTSLHYIPLPSGLKRIGAEAFRECKHLDRMSIPGTVDSIGKEAFYGCIRLESVTVPEGVSSIGENAFGSVSEDFVIRGKKGSEAEHYARSRKIRFVDPSAPDDDPPAHPTVQKQAEAPTAPSNDPPVRPTTQKQAETPEAPPSDSGNTGKKKGFFAKLFGRK